MTMAWGGLAVTAIALTSLVLFSIYHMLSGLTTGAAAPPTSTVWLIGVVGAVVGAACSMLGFALGIGDSSSRAVSEASGRSDIAA